MSVIYVVMPFFSFLILVSLFVPPFYPMELLFHFTFQFTSSLFSCTYCCLTHIFCFFLIDKIAFYFNIFIWFFSNLYGYSSIAMVLVIFVISFFKKKKSLNIHT